MFCRFYVLQVLSLLVVTSSSFDLGGGDDWLWPGTNFDGFALGYGFPGWELPPPLLPQPIVHDHFHHFPDEHDHVPGFGDHDYHHGHHLEHGHHHGHHGHHHGHHGHHLDHDHRPGPGYGYGGYGFGPSDSFRDYFCHRARRTKHLRKWLMRMLSCGFYY